jgi:hypothetical protein
MTGVAAGIMALSPAQSASALSLESVNVMDFLAVGDGVTDDGPAFLAAEAELDSRSGGHGGAIIVPQPPVEYYSPNPVNFTKPFIRIMGEGARVRMTFVIGDESTVQHMNGGIFGLNFVQSSIVAGQDAIQIRNTRQYEIANCQFTWADAAIRHAPPAGAAFHSIAGIRIHDNQFFTCNYHWYVGTADEEWDRNSDCYFAGNNCNLALISNVYIEMIDGVQILGNVMFMTGFNAENGAANPGNISKTHNVYVGSSNFVHIHDNNLFEAGFEAIKLESARAANITDNNIARPGQHDLYSGISINAVTSGASSLPTTFWGMDLVCADNVIRYYTKHGIELSGNYSSVPRVTNNVFVYYGSTPSYLGAAFGGAALASLDAARGGIYTTPGNYSGPSPETGMHQSARPGESVRLAHLSDRFRVHARASQFSATSSAVSAAVTFQAATAAEVGTLYDASYSTSNYGGMLLITAKRTLTSSAKTSTYLLLVARNGTSAPVPTVIAQSGYLTGAAGDDPAFSFTISGGRLLATPQGSSTGDFYFEYTMLGNLLMY